MAARRLLIVMLVLLGISTLAAALVPTQDLQDDQTGSTAIGEAGATETEPPKQHQVGNHLEVKIRVGGTQIPVVKSAGDSVLDAGDRLTIEVACKCSDLVEIPGFGLIEAVAPGSPALFDLLLDEPGSYGIKLVTPDRVVARIEVEKRQNDERAEKDGSGKGPEG